MIDIIIPVYNTPIDDLKRCLDSIKNQTFKNYKIFIIDDGSNEEIKNYLELYKKENVIVKHIENGGASNARNIGINISSNKYLTFIDSDDTIEPLFLEEAYQLIEENNLDVIIGGYNEISNNQITKIRKCDKGFHIYEKNALNLFFDKLLSGKTNTDNKEIASCPTGRIYTRLYRRDIIKNVRFNNRIHMSEDTLFMIDLMNNVKKIGIIDKIWYNYYQNDYSIVHSSTAKKKINYIFDFIKEIKIRQKSEKNKERKDSYKKRILKAYNEIKDIIETCNINSDILENEIFKE